VLTRRDPAMQGEEKDSSDDEWATAYAEMDPASQLGWRNRRGADEGPSEQLVRDVFQIADELHSDAMSEMVGRRRSEGAQLPLDDREAEEGSLLPAGPAWRSTASSVEVNQEG
jgi:hypothetical protein